MFPTSIPYSPLRDKIIVRPEVRIQSTLYVKSAEADTIGVVVAVGPDASTEGIEPGQRICFGTLAKDYKDEYLKYESIVIDDIRYLKMSWQDIAAIIED